MWLNWSDPALADLDSIYEFIARDAPNYASCFVEQLLNAVSRLEIFPYSGRTVPEANSIDIREVIFQGYRIMYWIIDDQRIDIIAVIHGSRDLSNAVNQPWEVD